MNSSDCNLSISLSTAVDDSTAEDQAMEYTIMVTIICVAALYACIQMIRQISLNEVDGARYSLQTFSIFTAWDVFMCIFHFYGALTNEVEIILETNLNILLGLFPLLHYTSILVFHPCIHPRSQTPSTHLEGQILPNFPGILYFKWNVKAIIRMSKIWELVWLGSTLDSVSHFIWHCFLKFL